MAVTSVKVTCNGQTVNLTKGTGDTWTGTFVAPAQSSGSNNNGQGPGVGSAALGKGYYPVTVVATDDAGNETTITTDSETFGDILKLAVLEKTKPTCAITYPAAQATITNAKPTITFTVSDSGSGINPAAVYLKIDSGTPIAITPSGSGSTLNCSYTPTDVLSEGAHTIVVYATDYDGNRSDEVSATFRVDTVPPTLNVTSPTEGQIFADANITVTGTTNDATSSPVTVEITCGGNTYTPTVTGGSFSQAITLSEGNNVITIVATDAAGKSSTVTRNVKLDSSAPEITSITLTPNPADGGATLSIQVVVTDI